jgi:TRAP-type mannitol/chloroaromatic compound transport system permease small subunit
MLLMIEKLINSLTDAVGKMAALLLILLLFNVFYDVVMRYVFNDVSIGMQELEWHLYSSMFLLGIAYTLRHDAHVRVDLIYEQLTLIKKAWVNLIGCIVFLLPFVILISFYGLSFALDSYQLNEQSGDPGGLSMRWLIKGMIPFSFATISLAGFGLLLHSINTIRGINSIKKEAQS